MGDPTEAERKADAEQLEHLGYRQELARRMGGFSNFALSFSIICILAGGVTSFHVGLCGVGGASIGLGWPLVALFALAVAATMGQVASAFPTAGGLYHWAAILGGRGWGWVTAWFNLLGLVTVAAAINVGAYRFVVAAFDLTEVKHYPVLIQTAAMLLVTASQAALNHRGIRVTARLTDFSGYWILFVSFMLTALLLASLPRLDLARLVTFDNFSRLPQGDPFLPRTDSLALLFAMGLLLPAYTLTGFDGSAHAAEETVGAGRNVPHGIVRSVLVSGAAGWVMLAAVVLAAPDLATAAGEGDGAFVWIVREAVPGWAPALFVAIALAQYLCGLATVTSASRMAYAFARDGGLPFSARLRWVSPVYRTPVWSVWAAAGLSLLFTVWSPAYETIASVCAIFLYISYVLPTALGLWAWGRTWTHFGPWQLGRWYRPLAAVAVLGCVALVAIGMQPPYERAGVTVAATLALLALGWFAHARRHFPGPPLALKRSTTEPSEAGRP